MRPFFYSERGASQASVPRFAFSTFSTCARRPGQRTRGGDDLHSVLGRSSRSARASRRSCCRRSCGARRPAELETAWSDWVDATRCGDSRASRRWRRRFHRLPPAVRHIVHEAAADQRAGACRRRHAAGGERRQSLRAVARLAIAASKILSSRLRHPAPNERLQFARRSPRRVAASTLATESGPERAASLSPGSSGASSVRQNVCHDSSNPHGDRRRSDDAVPRPRSRVRIRRFSLTSGLKRRLSALKAAGVLATGRGASRRDHRARTRLHRQAGGVRLLSGADDPAVRDRSIR